MKQMVLLTAVGGDLLSLVSAFLMFICVLALAYWFSRFLGKRMKLASSSGNRHMKVIEQLSFRSGAFGKGSGEQLVLLKIKEETYLLEHLEGEFAEASPAERAAGTPAFTDVFRKYTASLRKEKGKKDE